MRRWMSAMVLLGLGLDSVAHAEAPGPEGPADEAPKPFPASPGYFVADAPGGPTIVLAQAWASRDGTPSDGPDRGAGTAADVAPYFAPGARALGRDFARQGYVVEVPGKLDAAAEALVGQRLEVLSATGRRCVVEVTRVARQRFYSIRSRDDSGNAIHLARGATEAQILTATDGLVALWTSAHVKPVGRCPAVGIAAPVGPMGPMGSMRAYRPAKLSAGERKALIEAAHATSEWQGDQERYATDRADIIAACPRAARSLPPRFDEAAGGLEIAVFAATDAPRVAWVSHPARLNRSEGGFPLSLVLIEGHDGWAGAYGRQTSGLAWVAGAVVGFGPLPGPRGAPDRRTFSAGHPLRSDAQHWGFSAGSEEWGDEGHCNYSGTVSYRAAVLIERYCPTPP